MSRSDLSRLVILVFVGLFVLADAVLLVVRPERMWSYASQHDPWLRALIIAAVFGMLAHFAYEWWPRR